MKGEVYTKHKILNIIRYLKSDMYKEQVQKFLNKSSDKQKLIVIYGPTGAGKTSMSIEIAKYLQTDIISTDSRQIYKYMDIGTGKITSSEMQGIKHHMIDIINPDEVFSVGDFKERTVPIIEALHINNKIPLLVGGTGLYINTLIYDFKLPKVPADKKIRAELDVLSIEELYKKLVSIDPEYAAELHPNNRPYIERAIEVKLLTGKSKTVFREEKILKYDVLFLTPHGPFLGEEISNEQIKGEEYRQWLYNRINTRVSQMMQEGLIQELQHLMTLGYTFSDPGMKSIGYQEFEGYFSGDILLNEVQEKIQQNSRNYAKRQLTWFIKYERK